MLPVKVAPQVFGGLSIGSILHKSLAFFAFSETPQNDFTDAASQESFKIVSTCTWESMEILELKYPAEPKHILIIRDIY